MLPRMAPDGLWLRLLVLWFVALVLVWLLWVVSEEEWRGDTADRYRGEWDGDEGYKLSKVADVDVVGREVEVVGTVSPVYPVSPKNGPPPTPTPPPTPPTSVGSSSA